MTAAGMLLGFVLAQATVGTSAVPQLQPDSVVQSPLPPPRPPLTPQQRMEIRDTLRLNALQTISVVMALIVYALAALAAVYMTMYLVKSVLSGRGAFDYRQVLPPIHVLLCLIAGGGGAWTGGWIVAAAAGIGAAASALLHDVMDGFRALKVKR